MPRIVEWGLLCVTVFSVLAFGGTEDFLFSLVPPVVFGLALLYVLASWKQSSAPNVPLAVPLFLAFLVVAQIIPLPGWFVLTLRDAPVIEARDYMTLSLAPNATFLQLFRLLTYLTAFGLTVAVCQDSGARKRIVIGLVALATFESFYGLVQYLTGWQQIFGYVKQFSLQDASGTYINRNHFAGLLEMILPFCLAWSIGVGREEGPGFEQEHRLAAQQDRQKAVFLAVLSLVMFVAVIFSRSRMGILAVLVSVSVLVLVTVVSRRRWGFRALVLIVVVMGAIVTSIWIGIQPVVSRYEQVDSEFSIDDQGRVAIWRDTWQLVRLSPVVGTGLGTYTTVFPMVQTTRLSQFVNAAHNDYLQFVAEIGFVGAGVLFGSIFWLLVSSFRRGLQRPQGFGTVISLGGAGSIIAIAIHSLTDFNLQIPANALVFSIVLGLCYTVCCRPTRQVKRNEV
jgi:O-antigen ligase